MKYKVAQIPSVGMMVIEDENGILLSPAEVAGLLNSLEQRLAAAEAKIPDKPLGVFSEGVWVFATTAQTFTAEDLDIAAFVKYRDYMKGGE